MTHDSVSEEIDKIADLPVDVFETFTNEQKIALQQAKNKLEMIKKVVVTALAHERKEWAKKVAMAILHEVENVYDAGMSLQSAGIQGMKEYGPRLLLNAARSAAAPFLKGK